MIFDPFKIGNVHFSNRLLRSSVGGRMAHYDGTVTSVWKNFEKRFADGGVAGIISTTLNVNASRKSPLEYPPICEDRYVAPLRKYIAEIRATGCRYILQLGDPGYATQTSLFSEDEDSRSSSSGMDLIYGYRSGRTEMTEEEIEQSILEFGDAAARARAAGADGIELTASKGYLIHQFLNPGINRRKDRWGGSHENRCRFLVKIVENIRAKVGRDFLFGIRLAAADYNYLPLNIRLPIVFPLRNHFIGNGLEQTLDIARKLRDLGVDFLHIDSGFGFVHPRVTPGDFPFEEARMFYDSTRHLSTKALLRGAVFHALPAAVGTRIFGLGWRKSEGINLEFARRFKKEIGIPVIANGGFQYKEGVTGALERGDCDLVSMARALIANPDLPKSFQAGANGPSVPCTHCNRCAGRTATSPLGCYDESRFPSSAAMYDQIMQWNRPDEVQ